MKTKVLLSCVILAPTLWCTTTKANNFSGYVFAADTGKTTSKPDKGLINTEPSNLSLKAPANIERKVDYDPATRQYIITQTLGGKPYGRPMYMSFDEYQKYELERNKQDYFKQKSDQGSLLQSNGILPKLAVNNEVFDRIFGGSQVSIRPQGSAELIFGIKSTRTENPLLSERQRSNTTFDFDQKIQLNVLGNIGDKLKVTTNYNTEATFDFENQLKLDYTGYEDEIIKKIELGNVSLPLSSSLINGSQSLFGIKTKLQFGRLAVTSILTQQKSEQKEIVVKRGSQYSDFKINGDLYENNKHFFLSHFFRDNYNKALSKLPVVQSDVQITKIEVWVSNTTYNTTDTRRVLAFIDLGENNPNRIYNTNQVKGGSGYSVFPSSVRDNTPGYSSIPSNNLLDNLPSNARDAENNPLDAYFTSGGTDNYARLTMRLLNTKEYSYNAQLGYISLNSALNDNQVLSVSYRYTYQGKEYTVGEFSNEIPETQPPKYLITKLIKNIAIKTILPTWDLMMKNVYNLSAFQLSPNEFKLDVLYLDQATATNINYLPQGDNVKEIPLIRLMGLDKLSSAGLPYPDGVFDFVDGITINSTTGRVYFPVLEPFGSDLAAKFNLNDPAQRDLANKYSFQQLYDTTRIIAQQSPDKNRFSITGSYQTNSSSEYSLNAINIPQGSVKVTAGGAQLREGVDFTVDYNIGKVRIINEGVLKAGNDIRIKVESSALFGIQQKTLLGSRFDYKLNDKVNLGGTVMRLSERPLTQKVNVGDEPIANTVFGADANYRSESRFLTSLIDRIPLINTKAPSTVSLSGEYAYMLPGHPSAVNGAGSGGGVSYIDDFEGTRTPTDMRSSISWSISSTPLRFPESLSDSIDYGYHRAHLAYYNINRAFYDNTSTTPAHIKTDRNQLSDPYLRDVLEQEVFPNKDNVNNQPTTLPTFNLNYYPAERGPYNFNTTDIDANGKFNNPARNWAGIYRRLDQTNFESVNYEYIEFWMLDPFIKNPSSNGVDLYFNLGNISEDVLKDKERFVENALPRDGDTTRYRKGEWGNLPINDPITTSFDNDPNARQFQDVGLDGLNQTQEQEFYKKTYIDKIEQKFGNNSTAYQNALKDPSGDDYRFFLGNGLDAQKANIYERYKYFNNTEGNSPTGQQSLERTGRDLSSATQIPDNEDLNNDNLFNTDNSYFQYKVHISPQVLASMDASNYVTDKVTSQQKNPNGQTKTVNWYQFKIPIRDFDSKVGQIADFSFIPYVRMFLTNATDSINLRFARLELVRSEWRKSDLNTTEYGGTAPDDASTVFDISTVSVQDNGNRSPIPYKLPPGIAQERNLADVRGNSRQNEQSLALTTCNLSDGSQRAAYKNVSFDFRNYKRIEMSVHGETSKPENTKNGDLTAFVRFGSDYNDNYYEYEVPLELTQNGSSDPYAIWPEGNKINLPLTVLQSIKQARNSIGANKLAVYGTKDGKNYVRIKGNPDLSKVRTIVTGIRNPGVGALFDNNSFNPNPTDDGQPKCAQVWVNELRLADFNEEGGWAATGRLDMQMADLANVTLSGTTETIGWGGVEQKLAERRQEDKYQYDAAGTVQLQKFLPEKSGVKIPMYASYGQTISKPKYSNGNPDLLVSEVEKEKNSEELAKIRLLNETVTTRRSINFTNVHKERTNTTKKAKVYDVENLTATYAYNDERYHSFIVENRETRNYKGSLGYNYSYTPKNYKPLEKAVKNNNLRLIRDFNVFLLPNALNFSIDADRYYSENKLRNVGASDLDIPATYDKKFFITRRYVARYDFSRSLKFDYSATNLQQIDELNGSIENPENKKQVKNNILAFKRNTDFNQVFNGSYALPINKLPLLDWVTTSVTYNSNYNWKAALPANPEFANVISNSQSWRLNPNLNMTTLYNKIKFFKDAGNFNGNKKADKNNPLNKLKPTSISKAQDTSKNGKVKDENKESLGKSLATSTARLLISLKSITGSYTLTRGTTLPGYLNGSDVFGRDVGKGSPTVGFVFGSQEDIRPEATRKNWIIRDTSLNIRYLTSRREDINVSANIEPVPDLKIRLTGTRSYGLTRAAVFRATPGGDVNHPEWNGFREASITETGTFNISIISIASAFEEINSKTYRTSTISNLEQYRAAISERLGAANPQSQGYDTSGIYRDGYGRYAQQVVIPAFLATYTGKTGSSISLNYFLNIPAPNWNITYTGLTRIPILAEYFSTINLTHNYRSTFSINSFTKPFAYTENDNGTEATRQRTPQGSSPNFKANFLPKYEISQVTISEQFSPLIGFDATLKSNILVNFEYKRSRNLSMILANNRVEQLQTAEYVIGTGFRTNNFKLPFMVNGDRIVLKNDINFRFDITISDNLTVIHRLDQGLSDPTNGRLTYAIKPSIDYVVNQKVNIRVFYDRTVNKPYISTTFPTYLTNFGFSVRFSLS